MEEAKKIAKAEGVVVNQLTNAAVAEKVSALRNEEYFADTYNIRHFETNKRPIPDDKLPIGCSPVVTRLCTRS